MTADLSALIARLEAAEVGSRELDAHVWAAANDYELLRFDGAGWLYKMHADDIQRHERTMYISSVTTSLDAALALAERVLPVFGWEIHYDEVSGGIFAWVGERMAIYGLERGHRGYANTPALALCIAILRAKQGEG